MNLHEINETIRKLEQGGTNYATCERLAALYTVRDHYSPDQTRGDCMLSRETAEKWVHGMKNEDGTTGAHWTMEQAEQVMRQHGIQCEPAEFYAALNMLYSDFCEVFKKHGVNKIDFYADMAKAWLDDKDAVSDKLSAYYEYVVKH